VPYRTSLVVADRYDSPAVARVVDDDFRHHGAPLVWRADRASCHRTDEVDEVLCAWGVLRLHGPAHLARFYGQLERQNREHRGWLASCPSQSVGELVDNTERMRHALNEDWRRRSLGWMTAAEKWATRVVPCDDRAEFARHCGRARDAVTLQPAPWRARRRPPRRATRDRADPYATRLLKTTTGRTVLGDCGELQRS
jgi:hypothetical protein